MANKAAFQGVCTNSKEISTNTAVRTIPVIHLSVPLVPPQCVSQPYRRPSVNKRSHDAVCAVHNLVCAHAQCAATIRLRNVSGSQRVVQGIVAVEQEQ